MKICVKLPQWVDVYEYNIQAFVTKHIEKSQDYTYADNPFIHLFAIFHSPTALYQTTTDCVPSILQQQPGYIGDINHSPLILHFVISTLARARILYG